MSGRSGEKERREEGVGDGRRGCVDEYKRSDGRSVRALGGVREVDEE